MLSWVGIAFFDPFPTATATTSSAATQAAADDNLSFACFLLALCLLLRWVGPSSPAATKRR